MLTRSKRLCEAVEKLEVEIADRQESVRAHSAALDRPAVLTNIPRSEETTHAEKEIENCRS